MMTAKREPASPTAAAVDGRSPFVRLTELIAGIEPGKPVINLSVGEPQHPVPPFVGPDARRASRRLRALPRQQRHRTVSPRGRGLARTAATSSRGRSIRKVKCWCSTARAKDCFSQRSPPSAGWRAAPASRRCSFQIRSMPPMPPAHSPPNASRSICRQPRKSGFLPDLDALDDALLARTVAFYIASPSNPQGAVADRAYLEKLAGLARRFGFLVFADECYCEIYSKNRAGRHAGSIRARFRQRRRLPLAVQALEPARPARRLRRRRPPLPRPLSRIAQHRRAASADTRATRGDRRLR